MRPYVTCHMYVSVDGKIDGEYMNESGCDISGEFYDDVIFEMGTSMAGGRVTAQMYHAHGSADLSEFNDVSVPDGDYVIAAKHYNFCFDRNGSCYYDTNVYCYGGKTMQIAEVVSSACDKRYLAYLRFKNIAYVIADSVAEALEKIRTVFGVKRLVLTGGATINGGFAAENCIDEISLIMAPYIEGCGDGKPFVGGMKAFANAKYTFVKATPLGDGGVQLIFRAAE